MSKAHSKNFEIANDDVILHRRRTLFINAIEGALIGFLGFTITAIGIVGLFPSLLVGYFFSIFVAVGSAFYAAIGQFRNPIVRRIANHGIAWTYWSQRVFSWLFWVSALMAIYAVLSFRHIIPECSDSISILFAGLYFLLATPQFLIGKLMTDLKEARLCLLQFMSDWGRGKPEFSTGHSWLRRGLRGTEQRLKAFGIPAPAGDLFLGSSYSLFKGHVSNITFEELAKWMIEPSNYSNVNWTIPFLLHEAKQAEEDGFGRPRRILRPRSLTLPEAESAILIIISVGTAIYGLLAHFSILK